MKLAILACLFGGAAALKEMQFVGVDAPELEGTITISRTINSVSGATGKVTLDKDCTGTDAYGSNDCTINFGDTLTATYDLKLEQGLLEGSTIEVDAKLDKVVPFKFTCPACGGNCSINVPVIKKTIEFAMPPCPIKPTELANSTTFTLPAKSPIPIALSASGSIKVLDSTSQTVVDASFEAALK